MNTLEVSKTKSNPLTSKAIKADASGELPKRLEVLKAGVWRTPYHGDFMIATEDLEEYVEHFNAGIGLADGGKAGAPIDFSHENHKEAAAWIKSLETDGSTLFGTIEWTQAGKEAVLGGMYKFFSPEFYPKGRGGWCDPEDYEHMVENVLTGGGLTNIPLFKALGAIKASAGGASEPRVNVTYINASEQKEKNMPTLEEVRAKSADQLSEEDKNILTENKNELTAEELAKFGFETPAPETKPEEDQPVAETPKVTPAAEPVAASAVKGDEGNVVIAAADVKAMRDNIASLQASVQASKEKEVKQEVLTHVERGAIKADQVDSWTGLIMADEKNKDLLVNLPDNQIMADSQGKGAQAADATSPVAQVKQKAEELIKASKESGETLDIGTAMSRVFASNKELAEQYQQEVRGEV